MLDHVTITVANYKKSKEFYTKVLETCDYKMLFEHEETFCGFGKDRCIFWIGLQDETHSTSKNIHIAFSVSTKDEVNNFHNIAIALGAKDNGNPGYREMYGPGYYASFVIDEDGNNLEAVFRE